MERGKRSAGRGPRLAAVALPWALAWALALALAACAGAKPFEYHPIDEIPEGPGLVTGEDGEWVIYGD